MTQSPAHSKRRISQLDGVRALAIGSVFLAHALRAKLLWMGVDLFFILSGFLITGILLDKRESSFGTYIGHFYRRRAFRILPPYLILLILTVFVAGAWWLRHWYLYLFLMNYLEPWNIAHPDSLSILWSLAVEEQFYLVWPVIVFFASEKALYRITIALLIIAPILRGVCAPWFADPWHIYMLTPFRMDTLAAGALLAILWRHHRDRIEAMGRSVGGGLFVTAFMLLLFFMHRYKISTYASTRLGDIVIYECGVVGLTGVMLWALSGKGVQILTWSPMRYVGRISYSLYLIHMTAIAFAARWFGEFTHTTALVSAVLTLLYGALSWHFLEKPLLASAPGH